jgi:hypothetical protein
MAASAGRGCPQACTRSRGPYSREIAPRFRGSPGAAIAATWLSYFNR